MLGNIRIRLSATGTAAVLCCWMLCFTALAIVDGPPYTGYALSGLLAVGVLLVRLVATQPPAEQPPEG